MMSRHSKATPGALTVLREQLGVAGVLSTALAIGREAALGDPFAALGPAWSTRERLSRGQARPAVWLYRALRRTMAQDPALEVVTALVAAEGVKFMQQQLGNVDGAGFAALTPEAAKARVEGWLDGFYTAVAYVDAVDAGIDGGTVSFKVSACALTRLSRAAGHPELASVFCAVDSVFFAAQQPPIALERPTTIARGDAQCHFRLKLAP